MKRKGMLQTAYILAAVLLLAAGCSQEDFSGGQGEPLPEGKYPVTFTATGLPVAPQTRGTADGEWAPENKVCISSANYNERAYVPKNINGNTATLEAASNETPFFWQNTSETKQVSAWYYGTGYNATLPTAWTVQADQSADGFDQSDFLYAPARSIAYKPLPGKDNSLIFYHQTAKVVINIRNGEQFLTDASQVQSVTINNVKLHGQFYVPESGSYDGLTAFYDAPSEIITARKLAKPNMGLDFGHTNWNETALASYEALVIPQTVTPGEEFIGIEVNGTVFYYKAEAGKNVLNGGHIHTYNIAMKGEKLQTGTVNSEINWEKGETGFGSIHF